MKRYKLFTLSIILFIYGVISCKEKEVSENNSLTDIVLIFQQIPENWKLKNSEGGFISMGKYEILYYNNGMPYFYHPTNRIEDTLVIKNVTSHIEIQHKYMGIDILSFIIKAGDIILFSYKDKMPIITVKNRGIRLYDYTYEQIKYNYVIEDTLSAWSKYKAPPLFFKKKNENLLDYTMEKYNKAVSEIRSEKKFLYSKKDCFSPDVFSFYKNRIIYRDKILKLENREFLSFSDIKQNDELLKYSYYREFIDLIISKHIHNKEQLHREKELPTKIYDYIKQNNSLSPKTKEYLLFKYMQRIVENCSNEEIQKYWNFFKKDCSASVSKIDYLKSMYSLQDTLSEQLLLRDLNGQKTTLESLLKKHKNKVIYIDFWASWCNPCRMMLPGSKKLHKEFNNKDVVFIYLALWDKERDWEMACKEEQLYENSFFVINSKTSTFVDNMKIGYIPYYMIYDKLGKLYQKDAPRPNTQEIRKILKDLTR